jgi:hypothetical protein
VEGASEVADVRRGRGGTGGIESLFEGVREVNDVREALRAWNGSSDLREGAVL